MYQNQEERDVVVALSDWQIFTQSEDWDLGSDQESGLKMEVVGAPKSWKQY